MEIITKLTKVVRDGFVWGFFFFALGFIWAYTAQLPLKRALIIPAPIGIAALIVSGLFFSRFTKSLRKLQRITTLFQNDELLQLQAPANHYIDDHAISGKLFLTDKRLLFKSYQQDEYFWPVTSLSPFKFYPSLFNAGGEFILVDARENKLVFEVDEIRKWKKALMVGSA